MRERTLTRLFLRFRARRDGRALARVFDATAPELLGVAVHLVRDAHEAEDLVQATFVAAIERAEAFDAELELRPWLYGILCREAAKACRRAGRRLDVARLATHAGAEPLDELAEAELPAVVRAALERCSPRYQEVLAPLLCDGRTAGEIARELGRSPGTVRMQIHRGLEQLRRALPAALGASAAIALPTRGLGAVRAEVLAAAGSTVGATPVALFMLGWGGLVMWKTAVVVGAALALALWIGFEATHSDGSAGAVEPVQAMELASSTELAPLLEERPLASAREAATLADAPSAKAEASLAAAASLTIRGRVVDAQGVPVAGASVDAHRYPSSGMHASASTQPDGSFTLALDGMDEAYVYAKAAGHSPSRVRLARALEEVELRLPSLGARLALTVQDPDGLPVPDAGITVGEGWERGFDERGEESYTPPPERTSTDAAGRARIESLPPGLARVAVRATGFRVASTAIELSAGEERELVVSLDHGIALEGVVVDGRGQPVPRAIVSAVRVGQPYDESGVSVTADADGRYLLTGIAELRFTAIARAKAEVYVEETLTGSYDATTIWNPVLIANSDIRGHVLDERDAPLEGWHVVLHWPGDPHLWQNSTVTKSDGSFVLGTPPEGDFHVSVRTPELWDGGSVIEVDDVEAGDEGVVLRVPDAALPTASFSGRLRYRSGAATPRASVRYEPRGNNMMFGIDFDAKTGAFSKAALLPGTHRLHLSAEGLVWEPPIEFTLEPHMALEFGEIVLEDPGYLTLVVRAPDDPLRGSVSTDVVRPKPGSGGSAHAVEGLPRDRVGSKYATEGLLPERFALPPGEYEIFIDATHYRSPTLPVAIHSGLEARLELELEPSTELTLRVPRTEGEAPPESVTLTVADSTGAERERRNLTRSVAGELATTLDLEPADYVFRAVAPDGREWMRSLRWSRYVQPNTIDLVRMP